MKKIIMTILLSIVLVSCWQDSNAILEYGESGLPKNCRALITENIKGYNNGNFDADVALNSINRYCGEFGSEWKNSKAPTKYTLPSEWTLRFPMGESKRACEEEKAELERKAIELVELIDAYYNEMNENY